LFSFVFWDRVSLLPLPGLALNSWSFCLSLLPCLLNKLIATATVWILNIS
jgi:hypothetical protein